jgi:hypothetical protein
LAACDGLFLHRGCHARALRIGMVLFRFRLYILLNRARLLLWIFFRTASPIATPALPDLRTACEIDGLQSYTALKSAAAAAFVRLPPEEMDLLTRSL